MRDRVPQLGSPKRYKTALPDWVTGWLPPGPQPLLRGWDFRLSPCVPQVSTRARALCGISAAPLVFISSKLSQRIHVAPSRKSCKSQVQLYNLPWNETFRAISILSV